MTKDKAQMIQDRINNGNHNLYKSTAVIADIEELYEDEYEKDYRIDVRPDIKNVGNSFHHIETIADIARGFDVHAYAVIVDNTIHVRLF